MKRKGVAVKRKGVAIAKCPLKKAMKKRMFSSPPAEHTSMSRVVAFGKKTNPNIIVVVFHALSDRAGDNVADAKMCTRGVDGALVVLPQSPDECMWGPPENPRFDWLVQRGTQDTADYAANKREMHRVLKARMAQVNEWLDQLLQRHGLTNSELILVGYSQGAILAALLGATRNVLGVGLAGGVPNQGIFKASIDAHIGGWRGWWFDFEEFIPASCYKQERLTKFCVVNGTKDGCLNMGKNAQMFAGFPTTWHWKKGAAHCDIFTKGSMTVIRKWMQSVVLTKFGKSSGKNTAACTHNL